VSIRTFEQAKISPRQGLEIADDLKKYFAEADATRKPVTESDREDSIAQAMRSVRPRYRSH